jgi:Helix-turn-helix domain
MRPDPLRPYPLPVTPVPLAPIAPLVTLTPTPQMPTHPSSPTARYLSNAEAAAFLRLSPRTLEKQRVIGGGPRFRKFGRRVMYAVVDLEAWADARSFGMTSDPEYTEATAARAKHSLSAPRVPHGSTRRSAGTCTRAA